MKTKRAILAIFKQYLDIFLSFLAMQDITFLNELERITIR